MEKVIPINKYKLSNGRRPLTLSEIKSTGWKYLGGVQKAEFRSAPEGGSNITKSNRPRKIQLRMQRNSRAQNN